MSTGPGPDLLKLLGERAYIALTEAFGGTRLYVPATISPDDEIVQAIGDDAANRLSRSAAGDYVRVPLARELRARHYRGVLGLSNAQIARRLGITETGVNKLFRRMDAAPVKGSGQLSLFSLG